jgi:hypothetical protein
VLTNPPFCDGGHALLIRPTEREKWTPPRALSTPEAPVGLLPLDSRRELFPTALLLGVLASWFAADRRPVNF